jgi:ATP-dependent Zn protease
MRLVQLYTKKMAMNERVSLVSVDSEEMSDRYNAQMEEEASKLLRQLGEEAKQTVETNRQKIELLVKVLVAKETLDRAEIRQILGLGEEKQEGEK